MLRHLGLLSIFALASIPTVAWAQPADDRERVAGRPQAVPIDRDEDDEDDEDPMGWKPGLAVSGNFNLFDARNVVGTQEGTTITVGFALDAEVEFENELHEWRNSLTAGAGVTRTPSVPQFVKTDDELDVESVYLLHLHPIVGPYTRVATNTTMFPGEDVEPTVVTYAIRNRDGSTTIVRDSSLHLTDPFLPLTFREAIGVFVQPIDNERVALEFKSGVAAEQTIASGRAIVDVDETPEIEAIALHDTYVVGAEVLGDVWGFFDSTKLVSYSVSVGALFPFKTSELPPGDDRNLIQLTHFDADVALTVKLFDWASLGYKLSVLREPLLVDQWQISNTLLLNVTGAVGSKAPKPKPPCDCTKDCPVPPPPPPPAPPAAPAPTID